MKILHVITSLRIGGSEHLLVSLLPKLRDLGNEVELLLFCGYKTPYYEQLENTNIRIHTLSEVGETFNFFQTYNPLYIFKLRSLLQGYDIVHTHNTACQFFVPLAKAISKYSPILVTTEHSTSNRRRNVGLFKYIDKYLYSRYGKVICISAQTQQHLRDYIGESGRFVTVNNGIDLSDYLKPLKPFNQKSEYVVTMVARFSNQKDQDTLIRAIANLPDNYVLWLIGDGSRKKLVEQLVEQLHLTNRIKFWGFRTDVPDLLSKSDVVVQSSHFEGFGLAAVEAMASGKPVIASDVDGLREVVNGAGMLFEPGNFMQLALQIRQLCETHDLYDKIVVEGKKRARKYSIEAMAQGYNEVYKELVSKR